MKCVKCDGSLRKVTVGEVEVDQCDKCAGVWFDFGELQQVLAQDDVDKLKDAVDNSAQEDAIRAACPVCGGDGKMVACASLQKRGVHIDTCKVCYGQWLDGGELEKLKKKGIVKNVAEFFRKLL